MSEITDILQEGRDISEELRSKLYKLSVTIDGTKNPELIKAIRHIFGDSYVYSSGNSAITYDMYCSLLRLLKQVGQKKTEELV